MSLRVLKALSANDDTITALYWGTSGLCAGSIAGDVFIWPTDQTLAGGLCQLGEQIPFRAHEMAVTSLACIGNTIISISLDGTISASNIETKKAEKILTGINNPFCITANEKANTFYIGTLDGRVCLVDSSKKEVMKEERFLTSEAVSVSVHSISNSGCVLSNTEVVLFNLDSLEVKKRLRITADCCNCVTFSTDGLSLLITTTEGTVRVVDTVSFVEVGCQKFDIGELNDIMPIDYGKRYVVAGSEGKIGVFNLNKMIKEKSLKVTSGLVKCVAVQQETMKVAVGGGDAMINLLDFD
jgi:WD40 repeat protein